jgi:cbb3-type cytochrome oxidase maturation protein
MNILYLLIPLGLMLVALMVWAFFWAVKRGQFDDLESPAVQILLDDDSKPHAEERLIRRA